VRVPFRAARVAIGEITPAEDVDAADATFDHLAGVVRDGEFSGHERPGHGASTSKQLMGSAPIPSPALATGAGETRPALIPAIASRL
jgi:hypothetical protein